MLGRELQNVEKEGEGQQAMIAPWQRRRHGMNLEPLTLLLHRGTIPATSASKNHGKVDDPLYQGGAKKGATENNVEAILIEKAQTKMRRVDTQTRFLCRMMDDLFRTGIWRESDRPTVERCHRVSCLHRTIVFQAENIASNRAPVRNISLTVICTYSRPLVGY